jgi:hypothetical protein
VDSQQGQGTYIFNSPHLIAEGLGCAAILDPPADASWHAAAHAPGDGDEGRLPTSTASRELMLSDTRLNHLLTASRAP